LIQNYNFFWRILNLNVYFFSIQSQYDLKKLYYKNYEKVKRICGMWIEIGTGKNSKMFVLLNREIVRNQIKKKFHGEYKTLTSLY